MSRIENTSRADTSRNSSSERLDETKPRTENRKPTLEKKPVKAISLSKLKVAKPFIDKIPEINSKDTNRIKVDPIEHPLKEYLHTKVVKHFTIEELDKMILEYEAIDLQFKIETIAKLPNFAKVYVKNCLFYGQVVEDKREGKGTLSYLALIIFRNFTLL